MTSDGNTAKVFLGPDIVIEPLVDQWYAWSHILAPHTGAMNMLGRHHPADQMVCVSAPGARRRRP